MKASKAIPKRKTVCRHKDGYDGHEIPAGEECILIHGFYCNGNPVKAYLCKEHAFTLYQALEDILY